MIGEGEEFYPAIAFSARRGFGGRGKGTKGQSEKGRERADCNGFVPSPWGERVRVRGTMKGTRC
jgi:hypothetical protein